MNDPLLSAIVAHHGAGKYAVAHGGHWFWIVDEIGPAPDGQIHIADIQRVTARHFGLTRNELLSDRRLAQEVLARHVAMYLSRILTRRSYPFIGRWFNRDHSVPMFAFKKITRLIQECSDIAEHVQKITEALA
jgi:chromosomal replication initiator protein